MIVCEHNFCSSSSGIAHTCLERQTSMSHLEGGSAMTNVSDVSSPVKKVSSVFVSLRMIMFLFANMVTKSLYFDFSMFI